MDMIGETRQEVVEEQEGAGRGGGTSEQMHYLYL